MDELLRLGRDAGLTADEVTSCLRLGRPLSETNWVLAREAGSKSPELALEVFEKGRWLEYQCYDDRGAEQGRAEVELQKWEDATGGWFTGRHGVAQDQYYQWYIDNQLQSGVLFHLCSGKAASCKKRAARGDRRTVIHIDKWRMLTPQTMVETPYLKEHGKLLGKSEIEHMVEDKRAQRPPVGTGLDQAMEDAREASKAAAPAREPERGRSPRRETRSRSPRHFRRLSDKLAHQERSKVKDREKASGSAADPKGGATRGDPKDKKKKKSKKKKKASSSGSSSGDSSSSTGSLFRSASARGGDLWRLAQKKPGRLAELSLKEMGRYLSARQEGRSEKEDPYSVKVPGRVVSTLQSSGSESPGRRMELGEALRTDPSSQRSGQPRGRARTGDQDGTEEHEVEGGGSEDGAEQIGRGQHVASEGHGTCEPEFQEPTEATSRSSSSSFRVERKVDAQGELQRKGEDDEPEGGRIKEERHEGSEREGRSRSPDDRGRQEGKRRLQPRKRRDKGRARPSPKRDKDGPSKPKRKDKREATLEVVAEEGQRRKRPRKGKREDQAGSGVSELHPDLPWENLEDDLNDEMRAWLESHPVSNLSGAQLIEHFVAQIWKSDFSFRAYLEWSLSPSEVSDEKVRNLFPLPLWFDDVEVLRDIVDRHILKEDKDKRQGGSLTRGQAQRAMRLDGLKAWHGLVVVSLNYLYGDRPKAHGPPPGARATAAQEKALTRLWDQLKVFLDDKEARGVPRTPQCDWKHAIDDVGISYTGEIVQKASSLTLRQILPGLPNPEHGGCVNLVELLSPELAKMLERPGKLVKEECLGPRPRPRVRCSDEEWPGIAKALFERGLVEPAEFVPTVEGEPAFNGAFGVPKADKFLESGEQVLRLIVDLRVTNWMMEQIEADTGSLTGAATFQRIIIEEGSELLVSGEDLTSAFYLFRLPKGWQNYMLLDKPIKKSVLGLEGSGKTYLGLNVLPMGWHSSVGLMQAAHRRLALSSPLNGGAGLHELSEISRLSEFPELGEQAGWSIYLDDTTFLEEISKKVVESLKSKPPDEQLRLRRSYEWWGIPTNERKSISRESRVERLGAVIDGKRGILRGSTKRCLEVMSLGAWIRERVEVDRKVLQVYAGKMVHLLQFRRCLFSAMEVIFTAIARGPPRCLVTKDLVDEMFLLEGLLPMAFFNLKAKVDGLVTASDASETGGGLCYATRLSMSGLREAEALLEEGEPQDEEDKKVADELHDDEKVLVIDLFAGIGGLTEALKKAGVSWRHLVAIEKDQDCRRLLRRAHPGLELVSDVRAFDQEALKKAMAKVPGLTGIVVGGGSPCQGLSTLSSERRHLDDERSALFFEGARILDLVKKEAKDRDIWAVRFIENVVADKEDVETMSSALKMEPVMVDAAHLSRARRPRLFWLSVILSDLAEVESIERPGFTEKVYKSEVLEEISDFLEGEVKWPAGEANPKVKFPTMTRSIPRRQPPPKPVGLERADDETVARWTADSFRYPPYVYHSNFMVDPGNGESLRPLKASEREVLMGFPRGHTEKLWKKKPVTEEEQAASEDLRCSALGNSFHTNAVAALFDHCFATMGLKTRKGPTKIVTEFLTKLRSDAADQLEVAAEEEAEEESIQAEERELLEDDDKSVAAADFCEKLQHQAQTQQLLDDTVRSDERLSQAIVSAYVRRQEYRGSDVRLDLGALYRPDSFPRGSVQANRWRWHTATAYRFHEKEHINCLELRALVHGLEWRCRRAQFGDCRAMHLTDSQVALAICVKGRSSSRQLNRLLKRYAALQLGAGVYPLLGWVESEDNPADAPSRKYES
eukprot:Skav216829  [mRNA]  locus=scaffold2314:109375:114908:+ [translate_table: standard]